MCWCCTQQCHIWKNNAYVMCICDTFALISIECIAKTTIQFSYLVIILGCHLAYDNFGSLSYLPKCLI